MTRDEKMNIFYQVKSGELSVQEADRLLQAVDERSRSETSAESPQDAAGSPGVSPEEIAPGLGWWKYAWMIPLWIGIGIMVLSALFINWAYINTRFFWFYCAWLPLALGILVMLLGVWSQQARWVHIRIQDSDGPKISFGIPLPIRLASWVLRVFGSRIPALKEKNLDQLPDIFDALGDTCDPISVEVDDEKDGGRVRVYIL